jgi:hypothetical protein
MQKYRSPRPDASDPLPDLNYDRTIPEETLEELRSRRPATSPSKGSNSRDLINTVSGLGLLMILCTGAIVGALLPLGNKPESTAPVATPTPAPHTAPSEQTRLVTVRRADPVLFRQMHPDGTWALAYSTCVLARADVLAKYSMKALPPK